MAKQDFSFDIVSEVSMPEVANAVDQARREISQRFDFKDTGSTVELKDTPATRGMIHKVQHLIEVSG